MKKEDKESLQDKRLSIFPVDARYFVKNRKGTYDLIILNLPDPTTAMINRFYTKEFFADLKRDLNPGGVVVTSITSEVNYFGEEISSYTGSIYKTLKEGFKFVLVAPADSNIFFASDNKDSITFDTKILASRFISKNIHSDYFTPFHFDLLLPKDRVEFVKNRLSRLKDIPVNIDEKPVTYFYSLILWDRLSGWKRLSGFQFADYVKFLGKIGFVWYLMPLLMFFLLRVVYIFVSKRDKESAVKFNSAFAIFCAGFAGMAFSIILIFAFQNIFGYVYQKIGLIVATFMFGLAVGAYFIKTLDAKEIKRFKTEKLLSVNLIFILIFSLALPSLIEFFSRLHLKSSAPTELAFSSLLFIAGFLTGASFPASSKVYLKASGDLGKTASIIESADHLGAFFSALLTGVIFVPILGLLKTCIFISALTLVALGLSEFSKKY